MSKNIHLYILKVLFVHILIVTAVIFMIKRPTLLRLKLPKLHQNLVKRAVLPRPPGLVCGQEELTVQF